MLSIAVSGRAGYQGAFGDVERIAGKETASKLIREYGGVLLYIPCTLNSEHPLCQLIGQETAQQLARELGGTSLEIPRGHMERIASRNEMILADSAAGMSQRQLAQKYQLTMRTIRKIVGTSGSTIPLAPRIPQRKGTV